MWLSIQPVTLFSFGFCTAMKYLHLNSLFFVSTVCTRIYGRRIGYWWPSALRYAIYNIYVHLRRHLFDLTHSPPVHARRTHILRVYMACASVTIHAVVDTIIGIWISDDFMWQRNIAANVASMSHYFSLVHNKANLQRDV